MSATQIRWPWFAAAAAISFVVVWIASGGQENAKRPFTDNLGPSNRLSAAPIPMAVLTPEGPLLVRPLEAPKNLLSSNSETRNPTQDSRPATPSAAKSVLAQKPIRIDGAKLFIDREQYRGKQVVLTVGGVFDASNSGAFINASGATFWMSVEGIDRYSFRYFIKNCSGIGGVLTNSPCKMPLLVTLTGEQMGGKPVVKNVKIMQRRERLTR